MLANASIITFGVGIIAGVVSKQLNLSSMCEWFHPISETWHRFIGQVMQFHISGIFLLIETVLVFVHPFCQLLAEMFLKKWEAWNELKVIGPDYLVDLS